MNLLVQLILAFAAEMPEHRRASIAWIAEGGFCEPETVLPLPDHRLLVSNVCDFRQQGNGFLTLLDAWGEPIDWRVVEGLDAPLGMALDGSRLHVVDNNHVRTFTLPAFEQVGYLRLDASVANDIAVGEDGTMYVTDTGRGQVIVARDPAHQSVLIEEGRFPGANGIDLEGDDLYIGGERLWRVDLTTGIVQTIGPDWLSDVDGIEIEPDGTLQITPVGGPLIRYRGDGDFEILGGNGISSANHGYAPDLGLAFIPTGFDNTVIAITVPDP